MPFDGSGNFNRNFPPGGWQGDATANIKIMADRHDQHDKDLADGLTNCITKDGQSQPTANIPMNGKRIVNMADPVDPDDAATKKFVQTITGWSTSKTIEGADLNGRLIFSGTGATGLQWTATDLSWLARPGEATKTSNRLVLNDKADGTGNDVFSIDENGFFNSNGYWTHNTSYADAAWRTISPGIATVMNLGSGVMQLYSNDTATTSAYQTASIRPFASLQNSGSTTVMTLNSTSGTAYIVGQKNGAGRWIMYFGDGSAESSTRVGSNFWLYSYDNNGANSFAEMSINRATHVTTFGGQVNIPSTLHATTGALILAATNPGQIYLRPQGAGVQPTQVKITTSGGVELCDRAAAATDGVYAGMGLHTKSGYQGAYGSAANWVNLQYAGGFMYVYADATNMGAITWQSDHRIKKNVQKLHSTWDAVKALNPIKYKHKKFKNLTEDDDTERWGFLAHELQEKLTPSAAFGKKDEEDVLQSINPLTLIATLTRALQEAMERIEVLEGAKT